MKYFLSLIFAVMVIGFPLIMGQPYPPENTQQWKILFEDDFNTFDNMRWHKCNQWTHGNEPQIYMDNDAYISNGNLVLKTERLAPSIIFGDKLYKYSSGQIVSRQKLQYGYYEMYAKLPYSDGFWPAFWFWDANDDPDNPWYNEIDVFEADGSNTNVFTTGISVASEYPVEEHREGGNTIHNYTYSDGYQWFGVYWERDSIYWFFDRQLIKKIKNDIAETGVQHPMQLIVNVALFPFSDNAYTHISNNSILPNYMFVDKLNGYQLDCDDSGQDVVEILDFSLYNYKIKKTISLSGQTTIPSNSSIAVYAKDYIMLNDGFYVPIGCEFSADICQKCGP